MSTPRTRRPARFVRHPAEVTADRLNAHCQKWHRFFTGQELDAIGQICQALHEIAESERA